MDGSVIPKFSGDASLPSVGDSRTAEFATDEIEFQYGSLLSTRNGDTESHSGKLLGPNDESMMPA